MTTEGLLAAEKEIEANGYDIDMMGAVSNIVYIRWFKDLRIALINQHMNYSTMINQGIPPILVGTETEYKVPVTIHDKPVGRIYLVRVSRMKWVLRLETVPAYGVHCIGAQTGDSYRLGGRKTVPMPQMFQDILTTKQ